MNHQSRILVSEARDNVGAGRVRLLSGGYTDALRPECEQLELLAHPAVRSQLANTRPDYTYVAAVGVDGTQANNQEPAAFGYQNQQSKANLIQSTHLAWAQRLMILAQSSHYSRDCAQPITATSPPTNLMEQTNESCAIAKIVGITLAANRKH